MLKRPEREAISYFRLEQLLRIRKFFPTYVFTKWCSDRAKFCLYPYYKI